MDGRVEATAAAESWRRDRGLGRRRSRNGGEKSTALLVTLGTGPGDEEGRIRAGEAAWRRRRARSAAAMASPAGVLLRQVGNGTEREWTDHRQTGAVTEKKDDGSRVGLGWAGFRPMFGTPTEKQRAPTALPVHGPTRRRTNGRRSQPRRRCGLSQFTGNDFARAKGTARGGKFTSRYPHVAVTPVASSPPLPLRRQQAGRTPSSVGST